MDGTKPLPPRPRPTWDALSAAVDVIDAPDVHDAPDVNDTVDFADFVHAIDAPDASPRGSESA